VLLLPGRHVQILGWPARAWDVSAGELASQALEALKQLAHWPAPGAKALVLASLWRGRAMKGGGKLAT